MSNLISRESLKQRINLNYNSHQYIDAQSIKDIINTEPSVEDKTEKCWQTGVFNSECDCEECSHKDECSGYEGGED